MKIAYKLTDSEMKAYKGFQWEIGKWYETTGEGKLCSPGWLHFYNDPLVGLFMNLTYVNIGNPRLFRAEVEGKFLDDNGTRCGYSRARLVEELTVPQISLVQRVRFAILCAKKVYKEKEWNEWADNWLSGKDRTKESAVIIVYAAQSIAKNAFFAVLSAKSTMSVFYAARSAESAAKSAFYAAKNTESAEIAAKSAVSAAESAFYATKNTKSAAKSTSITTKSKKIDLIKIARKAMEE